jgi:hypothetical protein
MSSARAILCSSKPQTRAADHGFGEQPTPNESLTEQATVALPEAWVAKSDELGRAKKLTALHKFLLEKEYEP